MFVHFGISMSPCLSIGKYTDQSQTFFFKCLEEKWADLWSYYSTGHQPVPLNLHGRHVSHQVHSLQQLMRFPTLNPLICIEEQGGGESEVVEVERETRNKFCSSFSTWMHRCRKSSGVFLFYFCGWLLFGTRLLGAPRGVGKVSWLHFSPRFGASGPAVIICMGE